MANDTIFQFADKFGIESSFGNWLQDSKQNTEKPTIVSINAYLDINLIKFNGGKIIPKKIDIYDHKNQKRVKKNIEVGYYEDNLRNRIIPVFLIIEITGFPLRIEVKKEGKISSPQKFGTKSYRLSTSIVFYSNSQKYQDIDFDISLFNQDNKKTDVQVFSVRVFNDGYLGNMDMRVEEEFVNELEKDRFNRVCGGKYKGRTKCTVYNGVYGPLYNGNHPVINYKNFKDLIEQNILTEDEKDIIIVMTGNEGGLDTVQSYDNQILTAGAMQKTITLKNAGEFPTQVYEFRIEFPKLYEKYLGRCGWEVYIDPDDNEKKMSF